ncbi:hypothetical protein ACWKXZ_18625 [Enterobacter hormaechei]
MTGISQHLGILTGTMNPDTDIFDSVAGHDFFQSGLEGCNRFAGD